MQGPRVPDLRSSNLRVARSFTEKDKDDFLHEAFEYLARFFENYLDELSHRNLDIEGRFRRIDSDRFTAAAYRNGHAVACCTVWFGGRQSFAGGIAYILGMTRVLMSLVNHGDRVLRG